MTSNICIRTKEDILLMAKMAEHAQRYEDMLIEMKLFAAVCEYILTQDERNFLCISYNNLVRIKRTSLKNLKNFLKFNKKYDLVANEYLTSIKNEIKFICNDYIELIDNCLLKCILPNDYESISFYHKVKGDYYRYLSEAIDDNEDANDETKSSIFEKELLLSKANKEYKNAFDIVRTYLHPCNPIRLSLALSYSIFIYELLNMPQQAFYLAKQVFDCSLENLHTINETSNGYKDCVLIMQLLKDNLISWSSNITLDI